MLAPPAQHRIHGCVHAQVCRSLTNTMEHLGSVPREVDIHGTNSDAVHCLAWVKETTNPHTSGSYPSRDIPACEKKPVWEL